MDENPILPHIPNTKPEKHIRTFGSDMKTLSTEEAVVAPRPPVPSSPQPLSPRPESIERLKTYGGDFSDRMKETHASTATVLAAEQDVAPRATIEPPEEISRSTIIYIVSGAVLLIAGGIGAYFAYTKYTATPEPVISGPQVSSPIFVDDREQITGSGPLLFQSIQKSVARPLAVNTVRLLYFADTAASGSIFSALQTSAPFNLLRNINAQGSMAGVVNINGTQSPFFILSVSSFSNTFAGMLSWEIVMPRNLGALFPPYPATILPSLPSVATTTATTSAVVTATSSAIVIQATTTSSEVSPTSVNKRLGFRDEVINNHDARVYRDEDGRSVILYGYWNQETLVIARDPGAFIEILQRLATSRAQ